MLSFFFPFYKMVIVGKSGNPSFLYSKEEKSLADNL